LQLGFVIFSLVLAVLVYYYAGPVVACLAPGLAPEVIVQATKFAQILALGIPPYVVGGLFSYLEMGNGGYSLAAVRASIQSLGLIVGTLFAVWWAAPLGLAWGFTGAYYVYFVWGALMLMRKGLVSGFAIPAMTTLRQVLADIWMILRPLVFLPFILQGNVAVERAVASFMGGEVVAGLDYARFITETGLILLAVPMGLAGLSTLSGLSRIEFTLQLSRVLPLLLMIAVPISAFLWIHSALIVHLLYERGAFNAESSQQTQVIVQGLALGFWAQVVGYVLTKALNAQLRNGEVLRLTAIAVGANLLVNVLLFAWLGPLVLGLSVSVSAVALLIYALRALHLGGIVRDVLIWLAFGTLGYLLLAGWTALPGWLGLVANICTALIYWLAYVRLVPELYSKMGPLFEHRPWRLA
jgi:putative peptidoglycan lipid II flippase